MSLQASKDFLKLPLEERRRLMREASERIVQADQNAFGGAEPCGPIVTRENLEVRWDASCSRFEAKPETENK